MEYDARLARVANLGGVSADELYRFVHLDPAARHFAGVVACRYVDGVSRLGVFDGFPDVFERGFFRPFVLVVAGGNGNIQVGCICRSRYNQTCGGDPRE